MSTLPLPAPPPRAPEPSAPPALTLVTAPEPPPAHRPLVLLLADDTAGGRREEAVRIAAALAEAELQVVGADRSAVRRALEACRAEVVVLVCAGARLSSPLTFRRLVEHLREHPFAGAAEAGPTSPAAGELLARVDCLGSSVIALRTADARAARWPAEQGGAFVLEELSRRLRGRGRELHRISGCDCSAAGPSPFPPSRARRHERVWRALRRHPWQRRVRAAFTRTDAALGRAVDIVLAALLVLLLAPLMVLLAWTIRRDSPGPALFRQTRVGRGGRTFCMYKFRTMRADASCELHRSFVSQMIAAGGAGQAGAVYKIHPDPRITRVGHWLRRTSLDELPQLFNILRGDMTLVGFRPPIPYELESYPAWYHRRFDGRPGLTGLWQVSGRNERTYEEMVSLDIEYLNRRSLLLDLQLLLRTVGVVLTGRGAY